MTDLTPVLTQLERCYDAIPRVGGALVETVGPFELFAPGEGSWAFYARPRLGATSFDLAAVQAVLNRQRELGLPEALEWVDDVTPALFPLVQQTHLEVVRAPLMVLSDQSALTVRADGARLLEPADPAFGDECAQSNAVAALAFGPSRTPPAGPTERDATVRTVTPARLAYLIAGLTAGHKAEAVVSLPGAGIVARGGLQSALGAAEVAGVATLPAYQRKGYGAAITALLAQTALNRGNTLVFLSAANETVARVYGGIGFRRVGTAVIAETHR